MQAFDVNMTPEEIYDLLVTHGVIDPACLRLGDRCIVGRWENVSERLENGWVCRSGKIAIVALGEASTWSAAYEQARARLP